MASPPSAPEIREFRIPEKVVVGRGAFKRLGEETARWGKKALLVTGRNFARRTGLLKRALQLLSQAGVEAVVFDRVEPEPTLSTVEEARSMARREECEVVIGLGGGSALDVGKAVAGLLPLPGTVKEYHRGRKIEREGVPFVAVPTTAGTGAEITNNSVLIDPEAGVKKSVRSPYWVAKVAIVDPELTVTMPPKVTASSGMDALVHAIEGYTSIAATPITDALTFQAVSFISPNLPLAYRQPRNLEAREKVAIGSLMAAMGFANSGLGAVHALAHPVGYATGAPHGVVCALLLPAVMEFNLPVARTKYAKLAQAMGAFSHYDESAEKEAARAAIERVRHLLRELDLPQRLRDLGLPHEKLKEIALNTPPTGSLRFNPRKASPDDLLSILEAAF